MGADRKPGSDLGREAIDWEVAYLFFAGLPSERRSYEAVAEQFKVSVRTVERHGARDRWYERAREVDRAAAVLAGERLRDRRAEKLIAVEQLVEASYRMYADQLRLGDVRLSAADLARLHALRNDLWTQIDTAESETVEPAVRVEEADATEHKLAVLKALDEAGVLQQLLASELTDAALADSGGKIGTHDDAVRRGDVLPGSEPSEPQIGVA